MADEIQLAQGRRLRRARKQKYPTAAAAAEALGLPAQTYYPYEQGKVAIGKRGPRFARSFGVNLLWLMADQGPMQLREQDPILDLWQRIPPQNRPIARKMLESLAEPET